MAVYKITGQSPFQILSDSMTIGASNETYVLQVSADGKGDWSDLFTVSAGVTKMATGLSNGSFYRMKNNQSTVSVNWRTECKGEGGGGGSQYILPPATENTLGGVKVGEGLAVTSDGTLSASGGSIDSGAVQTQIDRSISGLTEDLESGDLMVGMAAQLYSPDGVTSREWYNYRTTAGNEDVNTGDAELRELAGNATYPDPIYTVNGALSRGGEPVEGIEVDAQWGDNSYWQSVTTGTVASYESQNVRIKLGGGGVHPGFTFTQGSRAQWYWDGANLAAWMSTVGDLGGGYWSTSNGGTAYFDGTYLTLLSLTASSVYVNGFCDNYVGQGAEVYIYDEIQDDIPYGDSTYAYTTAWTPSLPQAVSAITLNGGAYVPQDGDELTLSKALTASGSAVYMKPEAFIGLGLNSFDPTAEGVLTTKEEGKVYYDANAENGWAGGTGVTGFNIYFIKAVTGLENGYVLHSTGGKLQFRAGLSPANNFEDATAGDNDLDFSGCVEVEENKTYVVYPSTAMPYIVFSVEDGDETDVCVHPRWSGKEDNGYEEYTESVIDLSALADCPLVSIGETRNVIDLQNKVFIENITVTNFSPEAVATLIEDGKVYGTDFYIDENYIYAIAEEPQVRSIEINNVYKDNDFSVEYFVDENGIIPEAIYATNYYVTNLVDKLRRLKVDFIHLDNAETKGEAGNTYEYEGHLLKWVENSGYTVEWLKQISATDADEGTGLIYAYIPDNTVLFDFKYSYSGEWRKIVYTKNSLKLLNESGNTVLSSVTIGNTFQWATQGTGSYYISGIFKNGYIGFRKHGYVSIQNEYNGQTENGHYELIDKNNYPYTVNAGTVATGIPRFNERGQIVKNDSNVSIKDIQFNTNASIYSSTGKISFITNGTNNGPERIFVPTAGGTSGQILQSNGDNAAPTFINWIRVVKVTSDEYDALVQAGETDPNTLYAIDDEE